MRDYKIFNTEAEARAFAKSLPEDDPPFPTLFPVSGGSNGWRVDFRKPVDYTKLDKMNASRVDRYLHENFSSDARPIVFLDLWNNDKIMNRSFWPALRRAWFGFDRIPHDELCSVMAQMSDYWRPLRSERQLPIEMTVYRGQDEQDRVGLSWTLDRKTAGGFAVGHRGIWNPQPVILQATIEKEEVVMYISARDEKETVLWEEPIDWKIVERPESRCGS